MIERKEWHEFKDSGMLWWINTILHMFGWAIVFSYNEDNEAFQVYPARVKFRGFDEKCVDEGYQAVTKYLQENIEDLYDETRQ